MLKRIRTEELALGMYVHEFCGSWMHHPFWRTGFLLQEPQDLARIRATGLREVWIDLARGQDVAQPTPHAPAAAQGASARPVQPALADAKPGACGCALALHPASLQQEAARAAQICRRARQAVLSMFQQARMGQAIDAGAATELVQEIADSVARNPGALISLARLKTADDYTYMHSVAVCALMTALARQLRLDESQVRSAGLAGLMHDLGKAAVPLQVLNKPGRLSDAEFAQIRHHARRGWELLKASGVSDEQVLDACLHHHERMDGKGYPDGLHGAQLGLFARMAAICDVYDAITSDRCYKRGWDPAEAIRQMTAWTGSHLDARLFQAFVKTVGIYPIGSLVRLESGRLAVVVQQGGGTLLAPQVRAFFSLKSDLRIPPELIDLAAAGCTERIAAREDPARWNFPDLHSLWSGLQGAPWQGAADGAPAALSGTTF